MIADDFIDPEHTGRDRELLRTFYEACEGDGGTMDKITLRGIRAVLALAAADRPAAVAPEAPRRPRYTRHYADGSWQGADHPGGPWRSIPAPRSRLPWSVDPPAAGQRRALSPVKELQERYHSAAGEYPDPDGLAAAIRALADHVIHERCQNESERRIYDRIRRVAAELEGADA